MKGDYFAINRCNEIKNKNSFENPYGDGKSSQRITDLLKQLEIGNQIIQKG